MENNKKHIADFINDEIKDDKVTKISLHGFTTRDTCLACLSNLASYCNNANIRQSQVKSGYVTESISETTDTFWKKLRTQLKFFGPINFFISSRIYFAGSSNAVKSIIEKQITDPTL